MRIAIDISQIVYRGTGVANFIQNLINNLLAIDDQNEYVFFGSSLRQNAIFKELRAKYGKRKNVKFKLFFLPPVFLDFIWNKLHKIPIETFIGDVDVFISSDWTQPPVKKAKNITILYDLVVYKYSDETHEKIINVQKSRLNWVKKECDSIICISEATKKDAIDILGIQTERLEVVRPGI